MNLQRGLSMRTNNLNPIFIEKTKDGETMYDLSSRMIKDRVIYLDCEIDDEVTSQITSLLFLLDREARSEEKSNKKSEPITFWINSPGGDVTGLFAIYDMMQRIHCDIITICVGAASSAAAILLSAGSPGMRYIQPHGRVMIHQIQVGGLSGSNTEIEIEAGELKIINNSLIEILARHCGRTRAKVKRDTKLDKYLSAQEAVDYGIVDHILPAYKKSPELIAKESDRKTKDKVEQET